MKHVIVVFLVLMLTLALSVPSDLARSSNQLSLPTLSPQQAAGLIKGGKIFVVDAMSRDGFSKFHVLGAINIPQREIPKPGSQSTVHPRIGLPKTTPIVVICN